MNEALERIRQEALARLQEVREEKELEELNSSVLGRSGSLTGILRTMGQLDKEQRAKLGQASNAVKKELEQAIAERRAKIAQLMQQKAFEKETLDVTEPGIRRQPSGRLHPMTQTYREIRDALIGMGFTTFHGPEVEYDDFNFTKLNLPKDHPARDMQDTFYVNDKVVLRTHTSPCEARALMTVKPPFRLVIPGRVFRVDEVDASHSPVFMQMEGLVVDKNISFADLKGTLDEFVHTVFGPDVKTRMRPSYFPFTEPSAEVDISCTICGGKGCSVCKQVGWIEIMPGGTPHPNVLRSAGLDPDEFTGFYVNIRLDRLVMMRYGVDDVRMFHSADLRFLEQFR